MPTLLDYARSLGVTMGSVVNGSHVGWTTNAEAVEKLAEAGAHVRHYESTTPRFSGWEVVVSPAAEVRDA